MNQQAALRRLEQIEARTREPDGPPTWCFFATERYQAVANYGGDPPDVVLQDVEAVERLIRACDEIRREHHLDVIDTAVLIARNAFPDERASASGIAGMIVEAHWHWDRERFGEDRAWRLQRSRSDFEYQASGRLGDQNAA